MKLIPEIEKLLPEHTAWRQELHRNAQTAFEETFASDFVAEKLAAWGIEVHRGLGKTGVVGVLQGAKGKGGMVGLRADMDALDLQEQTNLPYASLYTGKMHACGHDGHVAMLLAAAQHLAKTRNFKGTVVFIFQPAEESEGGAESMIKDGLFTKFPCEHVYGIHNWQSIPLGKAGLCAGPMMANADTFEMTVVGKGGHAAFPEHFTDSVLCAAHIVTALQSLVSRNLKPLDAGVISVTRIGGGQAFNIMPESVFLGGTARSFKPEARKLFQEGISRIAENVASAFGATVADYEYHCYTDATVNDAKEAAFCACVLRDMLGDDNVDENMEPVMGAEDFGSMLQQVPGCYIALGAGDVKHSANLHGPHFDFNDAVIPIGASYWVRLVEAWGERK